MLRRCRCLSMSVETTPSLEPQTSAFLESYTHLRANALAVRIIHGHSSEAIGTHNGKQLNVRDSKKNVSASSGVDVTMTHPLKISKGVGPFDTAVPNPSRSIQRFFLDKCVAFHNLPQSPHVRTTRMMFVFCLVATVAFVMTLSLAQPMNTTSLPTVDTNGSVESARRLCEQPMNAVDKWYYNTWYDDPHYCFGYEQDQPWSMLNTYRSGGQQGIHWKYTENQFDPDCLIGWDYYAADGTTFFGHVDLYTTYLGASQRWCAMRVYRSGGVQGKQWEYCNCWPL